MHNRVEQLVIIIIIATRGKMHFIMNRRLFCSKNGSRLFTIMILEFAERYHVICRVEIEKKNSLVSIITPLARLNLSSNAY